MSKKHLDFKYQDWCILEVNVRSEGAYIYEK